MKYKCYPLETRTDIGSTVLKRTTNRSSVCECPTWGGTASARSNRQYWFVQHLHCVRVNGNEPSDICNLQTRVILIISNKVMYFNWRFVRTVWPSLVYMPYANCQILGSTHCLHLGGCKITRVPVKMPSRICWIYILRRRLNSWWVWTCSGFGLLLRRRHVRFPTFCRQS
jgi:hypothetical protein